MCSSTLIYLLFTKSIHTVHPQISMIQLVAPSQTVSEMLDGHRERWRGWTSRASVFFKAEETENGSQCWVHKLYIGQISVTRWKKGYKVSFSKASLNYYA